MSDTPETDAALYPMNQVDIVWPDFARKLERERDQLKQLLAADSERVDAYLGVCIERDEARELLKKALVRGDLALAETKKAKENLFWSDHQDKREIQRELAEARDEINIIRNTLSKNGEAVGNGEHDFSIIEMIENLIQSRDYFIRKSDSLERERDDCKWQLHIAKGEIAEARKMERAWKKEEAK